MKCPECQFENPEGFQFCGNCGYKLKELPLAEKKAPAIDSERKHVTVLFSDLSGYTAMTERLDAEEVKEIMSRIFGEIAQVITKYEGFIERFVGDAVMAIFGVPKAHEDDPVRAIRAALEIHQLVEALSPELEGKVGSPLSMHSGINTGLVVTGDVNIEKGTHGLTGDVINLASRLEGIAKAGKILVGPDTYRQAEGYFVFEPLEPTKVKGKAEPVQAYQVVEERARGERLRGLAIEGISSPLIGRDVEFAALTNCMETLLEGSGGIVSIIGEAGLGKSRLMAEIHDHTANEQDRSPLLWLEGRTLSYGQAISYWPFQEILLRFAGISEGDGEGEDWRKLESSVSTLLGESAGEVLPYLATLLTFEVKGERYAGVKYLDGKAMGRLIFLATRRFFERLAQTRPVVLVFEDLHWMDESSALLLEHLLPLVDQVPLLICFIGRPDPRTPAAKLPEIAGKDYLNQYTEIRLSPLSQTYSAQLLRNLLEISNLPPSVGKTIIQKAEGNPFFLEEIIRSLIDSGVFVHDQAGGRWRATAQVEAITIPDTVQGVIVARLDRLDEDVKRVLRKASVIGRSFLYRVLRAVEDASRELDEHLTELQKIQLIREKQKIPELEYIFKHALAQEAIYNSILLQKRRDLHSRIGQALETLFPDRLEEYYGLLAYHYASAQNWEKAQEYLFKAGDRAGKIAADAEALEHYQKALRAYEHVFGDKWEPVQRASLERKIGEALFRRGEHKQASEYLGSALSYLAKPFPSSRWGVRLAIFYEILRQIGHRLIPGLYPKKPQKPLNPEVEEETRIYESIGWIEMFADPERFLLLGLRMLNFCECTGHYLGTVIGYSGLQMITLFLSLARIADKYGRMAVNLAEQIQHPGALGIAYQCLAVHDWYLCKVDKAIEHGKAAAKVYRKGGYWNPRGWGISNNVIITALVNSCDFRNALSSAQNIIRFGMDTDDTQILCWGLVGKGRIQQHTGHLEESIADLKKAIELAEAVPDFMYRIDAGGELGRSFLRKRELHPALSALEETHRYSIEHEMKGHCNMSLLMGLSEAYLLAAELSGRDTRVEWLSKARGACNDSLKQSKTFQPGKPEAMRLKGRYEWLKGKFSHAQRWWRRSLLFAEKKGLRYEEARTHLEMGERLKDRAHFERAEVIFQEIGAEWDLAVTREALSQF
jgi:class 3 adenylate cyclase/tetratricopeptide (TPR) repeat protein